MSVLERSIADSLRDHVPPADDYPTVGLPFILRELGARQMGPGKQCAYLSLLIAERGFPPPYPSLVGKRAKPRSSSPPGGSADKDYTLTDAVTPQSQWARKPVELWLEDFLPPANAAALDAHAQAAAADDMDNAAANLRLVAGGREP